MTELQSIPTQLMANDQRVPKVHVALSKAELQAYVNMRIVLRNLGDDTAARTQISQHFVSMFADYIGDPKSFGITQYPGAVVDQCTDQHFMTIEREHAHGSLLYLLNNPTWMGRAIYSGWWAWRGALTAIGLPQLHDDLAQWSSYYQLMKRLTTQKQFPRIPVWKELIESLVLRRGAVDDNAVASVAYIMRCLRDGLELHRISTRLIISDTGLVVDGPTIILDRRLP